MEKYSDTYAETLEAFGLAILIDEVLKRNPGKGNKVIIENKEQYYKVESSRPITLEMIMKLKPFQIFKFIIKDEKIVIPEGLNKATCFNYPEQKSISEDFKNQRFLINNNQDFSTEEKKIKLKYLHENFSNEFGKKRDPEFDVYRQIIGNPYSSFLKLFNNFYKFPETFTTIIKAILHYYAFNEDKQKNIKLVEKKPTALQLYNPNQGKGLNKEKANSASMGPQKSFWIPETMKISGSLAIMSCQYVKVGTGYDLKIYVPEFKNILLSDVKRILFGFKKFLKNSSPIKLDILNLINLIIQFIKNNPEFRGRVKNTIEGFYTVYQKDLGQNKAVANISFLNVPSFIFYDNKLKGIEWIQILEEQKEIISTIEEQGDNTFGLLKYRFFLGNSSFKTFAEFQYWYCGFLSRTISAGKSYVKRFTTTTLNKIYLNMEPKLSEIINDDGFQAIAYAIRKSTVSLQFTPKGKRKYSIRYGVAQQLQNKSKSKEDLAVFIGDFIATYNAETARYKEKSDQSFRSMVKDGQLASFYELLDKFSSNLVGALLASYGFALNSKESKTEDNEHDSEELLTN